MNENRQEEKNNKEKERRPIARIILAILVIIILLLAYRCSVEYHDKQLTDNKKDVITEFEDDVDAITQIDESLRQEAINTAVEEGMMNVNYAAKAVFKGTVSQSFNIKNIENNHGPIRFELFDEDGNSIYASKKIAPGYEMNTIKLTKELSKGTHDCTIKVQYAEEGTVATVFPITIEVK